MNQGFLHSGFFHHDEEHHEPIQTTQDVNHLSAPVTLRTMSKSDPHLDIPHLIFSQDEADLWPPRAQFSVTAHPSLNKIMSNLMHVHEGLRTPVASHPNLQALNRHHQIAESSQNASSAALLSADSLQQPTLRKSSSAIDWNGAVVEATRKASRQFDWQGALFDNSRKVSFNHLSALVPAHPAILEDHSQGGLVMSSSPDQIKQNMSVTTAQMPAQKTSFAQNMATSIERPANEIQHIDAPAPQDRPHASGMFGMFQRGFFSKPVMRNEEESYRYLMALDR